MKSPLGQVVKGGILLITPAKIKLRVVSFERLRSSSIDKLSVFEVRVLLALGFLPISNLAMSSLISYVISIINGKVFLNVICLKIQLISSTVNFAYV